MRGTRWDLASKPFPSTQNPFGSSFEEEDAEGLQADELVQDNLFYLLAPPLRSASVSGFEFQDLDLFDR